MEVGVIDIGEGGKDAYAIGLWDDLGRKGCRSEVSKSV
jgi:hypothetical protein